MNPEMFMPLLREALKNAIKNGTTSLIESFAETFTADELSGLCTILQKIEKKKRTTVDVSATR